MDRDQRQLLRTFSDEVASWTIQAESVLKHRAAVDEVADEAVLTLRRAVVEVRSDGSVDWRALPLRARDSQLLANVARPRQQPLLTADELQELNRLATDGADAVHNVKHVLGSGRFFVGSKKRDAGRASAEIITNLRANGIKMGIPELLVRTAPEDGPPIDVSTGDVLADWVGFGSRVTDLGNGPEIIAYPAVASLTEAVKTIEQAFGEQSRLRDNCLTAGNAVRKAEVCRLMSEMPVERLKDATGGRLRIGALTEAGITTVQAVLDHGANVVNLPGIGVTTAARMWGAAQTLWQTTFDEMPIRIEINTRTAEATTLLLRLSAWDSNRKTQSTAADLARAAALTPLAESMNETVTHLVIFPVSSRIAEFQESVDVIARRASLIRDAWRAHAAADPWDDFLARPADYFAMLSELGLVTEDDQKAEADLPDDIVDAVRGLELDTEYLLASLRGYQSFGARFALVQRKVIIGDEMGLGKTIEALAVLAHLRAKGSHHSLVICPAAVVTNWVREVGSKSTLRAHRVHGPERDAALRNWVRNGGVAVTTFETLAWFEGHITALRDLGCVVVDEAHYIKNPEALRTQRATRVIDSCSRAILLTGTPLENRIEEFANLVGYLRPDLVVDANELAPRRFRRQVAPAYLRRNQEDVLTELPELVEIDEWLPMSKADASAYRNAVASGNFMAMRQAAMRNGPWSEKLQRLIAIVGEAEDNRRRVIVFSHFRDVLDQVARALPGEVFGPLTGSVPAAARQVMVDQFSAAGHGAVLVSQIVAGGVGLNIQAASVVVICEPQLKPTTEWQAIARAHRMGQLETVQVHRLLSEEGIDQRITEILARKREVFNDFARVSETAGSAPEAVDVSEADLARDVIAAERERLFSQPNPSSDDEVAV